MICGIYLITAFHPLGQAFWAQPMLGSIPSSTFQDFLGSVDKAMGLRGEMSLQGVPINVAFMLFGGAGTIANIVNRCASLSQPPHIIPGEQHTGSEDELEEVGEERRTLICSYWNVIRSKQKSNKPIFTPLLGYLPFFAHTCILVLWLQSGLRGGVSLVHDARVLPFLLYWGMA